mmetsp:Transcript_6393/g.17700  ORF Transcript_6393/g.17700 Transcript_6393/m.17700 type:complete len:234 (-) Transcript_6393:2388-3089(-)
MLGAATVGLYSRDMYFRASSTMMTGNERTMIAVHSRCVSASTLNMIARGGTYRMIMCRSMDKHMAPSSQGLLQGGNDSSEQSSERAFRALNISTTTSTDMATVDGRFESKTEQAGFRPLPQCWNDRSCAHDSWGPSSYDMNHHKKPREVAIPTYAPMVRYRMKSHPSTMPSLELLGGFFMMSESGLLNPMAVAGRPSVTRFTQSNCTGFKHSGMPRIAAENMATTSPMFELTM